MFTRAVPLFVSLLLSAPAAPSTADPAPPSVPVQEAAPAAADQAAADVPAFYAPDPMLDDFVRAALDANPGVRATLESYRASLQRVPVATALPDPMLSVSQALRSVQTRLGPQLGTVTLTQVFPWFGTLDLRGQVAVQEASAAHEIYRARQRDVIAQVKTAYYNLAYVDTALGIANEEQALLEHYEELAQARYAQGQGLQQAVIKVQAEITKVVSRLDALRQQRGTLAARLNTLMNRPPDSAVPALAPPAAPSPVALDLQQLEAVGNAERPEIKAADALVGRGERAVDLAEKDFRPTLTLGASFVNIGAGDSALPMPGTDVGQNAFAVAIGVTLPIHRAKYRAEVEQAAGELSAARLRRADIHNEMTFAVRDQALRLETLGEQIRLVGEVLLPQTDEALRSTEAAYETGQLGVLELLDSERSRLDVRLVHARDTADYLIALANLEQAIGAPFPDATRILP